MYTDSQYLCPTRRSAQWLTGAFHLPNVYVYHLEYKPSVYQQIGLAQYWWYARPVGSVVLTARVDMDVSGAGCGANTTQSAQT